MQDTSIRHLIRKLQLRYAERLKPYGWGPSEAHGFGFTIDGIDVVFSAITKEGSLPPDYFDVQIESSPPGDYIYTAELALKELLDLIEVFAGPDSEWP